MSGIAIGEGAAFIGKRLAGRAILAPLGPLGWAIGGALLAYDAYELYELYNESHSETDDKKPEECDGECPPAADAPGKPTEEDGFKPPKNWNGQKVKSPNGRGYGWPDKSGNVWVPTGPGPAAHGGPHWDVQRPGGGYINVYPGGRTRGGV
ncbi:polymorphic toxin type 37 domain-containing protein [Afifella sp. YEN Y35]|uniref:polymorphic toxin type 37 domain-containing protein n=1 Tax=Afifella sp. YEN Y35 TaxID=3388337 RepID=UPI0039DF60AE